MKYDSYRYIFPPRPEYKIPPSDLQSFDDGTFMAEPKFNGDNGVIFFNSKEFIPMNRHGKKYPKYQLDTDELKDLFPPDWNCLSGEYMAKSKKDENKSTFNHKFVIFDMLVYDGNYLLGTTFEDRWLMLYNRFNHRFISENEYSYQITENIWLVKVWLTDFVTIWNKITKIDMIEGLVLKKRKSVSAKLLPGNVEKNNYLSQLKCRKSTKNYSY